MEEEMKVVEASELEAESFEKETKELSKLSIRSQFKTSKGRTRFITRTAMFAALATVFYIWLKFPLPFFPSFLEVNFSNLFIILGSLFTGPVGGTIIVIVRFLLKIAITGSHTSFVGELTDVILSLMIMLPASIIYMRHNTKKGGMIGILVSYVSWIISGILTNWLISMPFYVNAYGLNAILGMLSDLGVTESTYMSLYLFLAVLPFNALVGFVNCGLALVVYKRISFLFKKIGL